MQDQDSFRRKLIEHLALPYGYGLQRPATALTASDPVPEVCSQMAAKVN
jgi:hypothetical protein